MQNPNKDRDEQIVSEFDNLLKDNVPRAEAIRYLSARYKLSGRRIREICPLVDKTIEINDHVPLPVSGRLGLSDLEAGDDRIAELIQADTKLKSEQQKVKNRDKLIGVLQGTVNDQRQRLELFELLQSDSSSMIITPTPEVESEAIVIIQASDWHVGEFVHPEKVNYHNKYNPDIAEHSAKLFFDRSLKLIRKEQKDVSIRKVILQLGGDMMTGHIHEELKETVAFSPNEEAQFAKYLIIGGIDHWLDQGIDELFVVCNYGNHGRNDPVKKIATGAENSYEWAMYHDIAKRYENDPRVKFQIPRGEWSYVDIGQYKLRFTHLDAVRYVGGVGGISIPLIKAIHNWNATAKADMTFGGHFHQTLINDQIGFSVNNCLMGINPYGMRFGRPTPATQNFRLLDMRRGFTIFAPIVCDDGDRLDHSTSYPGMTSRWQSTNTNQKDMIIIERNCSL